MRERESERALARQGDASVEGCAEHDHLQHGPEFSAHGRGSREMLSQNQMLQVSLHGTGPTGPQTLALASWILEAWKETKGLGYTLFKQATKAPRCRVMVVLEGS